MILILGFGVILLGEHYDHVPKWLSVDPYVLVIPIFILLGIIPIYNWRNPNDRIKPTLIPMEFKEEDEGLQWITFKATRKVYIFYAVFMPFAIAITAYLNHISYIPLILLTIMGMTQYFIFWYEVKKHK
jgi:hypothetical protein